MKTERLDKTLANISTIGRSEIKKIISSGRVTVNGVITKKANTKIDIECDIITLDGKDICLKKYIYLMMNKPSGVVCAVMDKNCETVINLIPNKYKRKGLFPVGRLDKDTEGLLIITNDGDFAHRVTSPNKNIYKTYHAVIDSDINESDIKAFENGIVFKDGTLCKKAYLKQLTYEENPVVEVKICEGMFHQVKKMLLVRGKKVLYLKRVAIGGLKLGENLNKKQVTELDDLDISNIFIDEMH